MVYVVAEKRERVLMRLGDDRYLGYGDPDVMIGPRVGPLTIMHLIGEDDIGREYPAEHAVRKTHGAVKLLSAQLTENASFVQRFVNDVHAVAKPRHRDLSRIRDVGQLPSGAWYTVRGHLDGTTPGGYPVTRQHRHRRAELVTR